MDIQARHQKQLAVVRGWLEGRGYFDTLVALERVRELEQGVRKDGETPKLHHQLSVLRLLATLTPHFIHPQATLTAALLHDVLEDHDVKPETLTAEFGALVGASVWHLTRKQTTKLAKEKRQYFADLSEDPIASLVKLADRAHNLHTMQPFTPEKRIAYAQEAEEFLIPMVRTARRRFPQQFGAYENLKFFLRTQMALVRLGTPDVGAEENA